MDTSATLSTIRVRRSPSRNLYYDPSLPHELVQLLWQHPQKLVSLGRMLRQKAVRHTALFEWGRERYVIKHYIESSWWRTVRHSFSRSRAGRAWSNAHRLTAAQIATPCPVACVEDPLGRLRHDSFFMYRYVEGETLERFFQRRPNDVAANTVWTRLQEIWASLRSLHTSLTDTHARNFILSPANQIWVIDIDDLRFHHTSLIAAHYQLRSWKRLLRSIPTVFHRAA